LDKGTAKFSSDPRGCASAEWRRRIKKDQENTPRVSAIGCGFNRLNPQSLAVSKDSILPESRSIMHAHA
ncbi:hypothetical protein SB757_32260, partial [Pseudomonas sp. SIMBA_065]